MGSMGRGPPPPPPVYAMVRILGRGTQKLWAVENVMINSRLSWLSLNCEATIVLYLKWIVRTHAACERLTMCDPQLRSASLDALKTKKAKCTINHERQAATSPVACCHSIKISQKSKSKSALCFNLSYPFEFVLATVHLSCGCCHSLAITVVDVVTPVGEILTFRTKLSNISCF